MEPTDSEALPIGDQDLWAAEDHHRLCWDVVDLLEILYYRYPGDEDLIFARLSRLEYRAEEGANGWAERLGDLVLDQSA